MSKEFFDKYGKLVDCFSCNCIEYCSKSDSPLCSYGYVFFAKDKIADLESKLAEKEKEIDEINREFVQSTHDWKEIVDEKIKAKTDLAIEQLEQLKSILEEDRNDAQALLDPIEQEDYHELIGVIRGYRNSIYEVQKQINELKEKANVKD